MDFSSSLCYLIFNPSAGGCLKALIPLVGGKDFSRTCDINTDVTGILNDVHSANLANTADDSLAREVEAAEYADSRAGD